MRSGDGPGDGPAARRSRQPRGSATSIRPAAGRATTFQVERRRAVSWTASTEVYVSGAGVQATVVEHVKPIAGKQANTLREKLIRSCRSRPTRTPTPRRRSPRSGGLLATPDGRPIPRSRRPSRSRSPSPRTQSPASGSCGCGTPRGLSNPLVFCVGQLPEFSRAGSRGRPERMPRGSTGPARPDGPAQCRGRARDDVSRCRSSSTARSCPAAWTGIASRPARASAWSWPPAHGS